jgi:hypothetical protein
LAPMPIVLELGDAFRSWCNLGKEDDVESRLEIDLFQAGLIGYVRTARGLIGPEELQHVPLAVETIALELAARFCKDGFRESYFNWDQTRFAQAWEHNLARARGQWRYCQSVRQQRATLQEIVSAAGRCLQQDLNPTLS